MFLYHDATTSEDGGHDGVRLQEGVPRPVPAQDGPGARRRSGDDLRRRRRRGGPQRGGGAYRRALELLYAFSYAVKMSKMGDWQPEGYFDYVVPPLEGLWWGGEGAFDGTGVADKAALSWVSLIRQPDFVTPGTLSAIREVAAEKKPDLAGALESGELRLVRFSEGRCAQSMHRGPTTRRVPRSRSSLPSSARRAFASTSVRRGARARATSSARSTATAASPPSASTTRSTWATPGARSPRASGPSSGTRSLRDGHGPLAHRRPPALAPRRHQGPPR